MDVATSGDTSMPVLAQDLKNLRVPGKIAAVLWTMRSDRCTLQVVLPIPGGEGRAINVAKASGGKKPSRPDIELWLLSPEGTAIARHFRWDSPDLGANQGLVRATGAEINFQFPLEAARIAVAAVLKVDSEYRIEPIKRLAG
jgi:hypothetical protein